MVRSSQRLDVAESSRLAARVTVMLTEVFPQAGGRLHEGDLVYFRSHLSTASRYDNVIPVYQVVGTALVQIGDPYGMRYAYAVKLNIRGSGPMLERDFRAVDGLLGRRDSYRLERRGRRGLVLVGT